MNIPPRREPGGGKGCDPSTPLFGPQVVFDFHCEAGENSSEAVHIPEKSTGVPRSGEYLSSMVTDISLGLVFVLIFFVLGGIAFAYLAKGKN